MIANIPYIAVAALIIIGLYAVIFRKNLIKMLIGITIIESGVNLFLITLGYREDGIAPIFTSVSDPNSIMTYPVPQALTLTSIVIGVAVLALMLSFIVHMYRHTKSVDVRTFGGDDQ
jgi:multicomponent Na+:H+ antiporter subunit C